MMNKNRVRVLLVNGHNIVRDGLKLVLESFDFVNVCGEVDNIRNAVEIVPKIKPDIIFLVANVCQGDGIHICSKIKSKFPEVKILILSECSREYAVISAIRAGVDGYLLIDITKDKLKADILRVYKGEYVLDSALAKYAVNFIAKRHGNGNYDNLHSLSKRETDILQMISFGKSNKEIAAIFSISEKTVRNYISNIFKKLNVSNRTEAAVYWLKHQKNLA